MLIIRGDRHYKYGSYLFSRRRFPQSEYLRVRLQSQESVTTPSVMVFGLHLKTGYLEGDASPTAD